MPAPFQFDKAVLQVVADDKQMINTLKKDEAIVNQSVNKMQGNLNQLTVATEGTGQSAAVASRGIALLGTTAALSGNQTLVMSQYAFTAALGFKQLGDEALGAKEQLLATVAATWAYVAANKAAVISLSLLVAVIIAVRVLKSRAAKEELEQLKALEEASKKTQDRLTAELTFKHQLAALADKIAVAEERIFSDQARFNELRRAHQTWTLDQIKDIIEAEERLAYANERRQQRDKERAATEQRALRIAMERAQAEKQITDEIEARHRARAARFEGQGPTSAAEAQRLVMDTLGLVEANQRSAALTTASFNQLMGQAQRFGLDKATLDKLAATLGIQREAKAPGRTTFGAGAVNLSQFAASGRGMMPTTQRDPVEQRRIDQEEKRTRASEAIAKNTERLAIAFGRWNNGAG